MRQFVESLKRLYQNQLIDKEKIIDLSNSGKITIDEQNHILNVK